MKQATCIESLIRKIGYVSYVHKYSNEFTSQTQLGAASWYSYKILVVANFKLLRKYYLMSINDY